MVFPGQGIQNTNQILHLNKYHHSIKNTFEEASEYVNYNIWKAIQQPWHVLNQKKYTQAIILTTSVAIYRFWKKIGGFTPHIASGHSLGEYSVLVCSNAIKFSEGLILVQKREHMMTQYSQKLTVQMKAIIGLQKNTVLRILKKYISNKSINIASINSKKQIVISGYKKSIQAISLKFKKIGIRIIQLPINVAAHFFIMKKIQKKFIKQTKKIVIQKTQYPVINSITVKQQNQKNTIRKNFTKQLFKTVQWEKAMNVITATSDIILEVSTNNTLTNLHKHKNYTNIIPINNFKNIHFIFNLLKSLCV